MLKIGDATTEISAIYENDKIIVEIPSDAARNWIDTNLVGLENEQLNDADECLKITIEKDFVCLDRLLDSDNDDAFPHPKMNC
jgi:hypothetical protein